MANKSSSQQDQHSKAQEKDFKDQLLEQPYIHRITDWVTQNLKIIGIVAGATIFVLFIANIMLNYQKGQAQKAAALEGKAIQLHQEAKDAAGSAGEEEGSEEVDKLYQDTIASYKQLLNEYSGSPSAERALFLVGSLEYDRGNYTESREHFSAYIKKYGNGELALSAKESLAYIFEQEGEYQKALDSFKELEKSVSDAKKADIQLALARNYRSLGQQEEAAKIYQDIIDSNTTVSVKNQASEALAIVQSDQEFPPPVEEPEAEVTEEAQPEAETTPEAEVVEEALPEAEVASDAEVVEEAQPESAPEAEVTEEAQPEATPEAEVVEEAQPEATPEAEVTEEAQPEATPEAEVTEEAQPEATPEAEVVEEAQPEAAPEAEVVEEAQPEATPEAEVVEEAQPEATPEVEVVEEAQPEATPEAEVVEEAQPEATPEAEVVEEAQPEAIPEAEVVEEAQPEATPEAEVTEEAQPEVTPEAEVVEEAQPEASPVEKSSSAETESEDTN